MDIEQVDDDEDEVLFYLLKIAFVQYRHVNTAQMNKVTHSCSSEQEAPKMTKT